MASSRFLLPAGAAILMGLISKGVASDAARRDRAGVEPSLETSAQADSTAESLPMVASFADDEATSTDDDLDDDSTVP